MNKLLKNIKLILHELELKKLLAFISNSNVFYDEPRFYSFGAGLDYDKKYSDGLPPYDNINGSGFSFTSKYEALVKCLGEAMERLSVYCFKKKSVTFSTRTKLKKESMPLTFYYDDPMTIDYINLGWVKGFNFTKNTPCFIPGQMVYLNFSTTFREHQFNTLITTGAAGGYTHEETLLAGIYEIVERDAYMTAYLNKISLPRINLQSLNDKLIDSIIESFRRYNLEIFVFEMTNDLQIPAFMAIIIDKTGLGPAVSVGLKAGFNIANAIIGSIMESLSIRIWTRYEMYKNKTQLPAINPLKIKTQSQRGLYWSHPEMIKKLDYLLKVKPVKIIKRLSAKNTTQELSVINNILSKKGFEIFYKDITLEILGKLNYRIYKVIIPALQPVYLDEKHKELRIDRIKTVARHFGRKRYYINPVPQPFL